MGKAILIIGEREVGIFGEGPSVPFGDLRLLQKDGSAILQEKVYSKSSGAPDLNGRWINVENVLPVAPGKSLSFSIPFDGVDCSILEGTIIHEIG
jgi:hypothetical protein